MPELEVFLSQNCFLKNIAHVKILYQYVYYICVTLINYYAQALPAGSIIEIKKK